MWRYLVPVLVAFALALGIAAVLRRRRRVGDTVIPVHLRPSGCAKWRRGRALWVHDVLAFRPGRGSRREDLFWVVSTRERPPTTEERWWMHRQGGDMVVGTLRLHDGGSVDVAARRSHGSALFAAAVLEQAVPAAAAPQQGRLT